MEISHLNSAPFAGVHAHGPIFLQERLGNIVYLWAMSQAPYTSSTPPRKRKGTNARDCSISSALVTIMIHSWVRLFVDINLVNSLW